MLKLNTILHPTDFSEQSKGAFHLAQSLAVDHEARLIILHVVPPSTELFSMSETGAVPDALMEEMGRKLTLVQPENPLLPVERMVEQGDPATLILSVADECEADLIVMATHGRRGLSRMVMGSVAEAVLRGASCPVVTMRNPPPATEREPSRFAVP